MKDVLPFFTLDGSVGLYNEHEDDIYHSVYGAFSEAYDKFILPANLKEFLNKNSEIKILDICYGIGYNTKSFLNYFLENFSQKNFKKVSLLTESIEQIHTNNILKTKYNGKIYDDNILMNNSIDEIHGNNILKKNFEFNHETSLKNERENVNAKFDNSEICSENFSSMSDNISENSNKTTVNSTSENPNYQHICYKIKIDSIDNNELLMKLSPLFDFKHSITKNQKTGIRTVDKYLSAKTPNNHKYKLKEEVNYILYLNLLKQYGENYFTKDVIEILSDKTFKKYFSQKMINFVRFYQNRGYNLSYKANLSMFLHNIYYQYISKCYKNTLKVLENNEISINYINDDARNFVKQSFERYNFIFLDAFTPTKCPALWTKDFFEQLYQRLSYDGMLLTYSSSSAIRSAMLKSNFYIGKIFNENENKFTGTVAVKNPDLIKYPLDKYEVGLLKSKAGIVFRDKKLSDSNEEIIERRHKEVLESNLISSSQYIKNFKELSNEI